MGLDAKLYWLTDHQLQCDFDTDFFTAVEFQMQSVPDEESEVNNRISYE
jgi:hypothetical protein